MLMSKKKLAIIIPAYKATFLEDALNSIAEQSCQDFTVYIGDDCSPNDLYLIVSKFESEIDIIYKRFEENLGGKDLVAQWERCVDMSKDEEWVWLFSDDDIMDVNCVELFYQKIDKSDTQLLHFNVKQIDDKGTIIKHLPEYPQIISAKQYLDMKIKGYIYSFVVEFIFSRKIFEKNGRFENFDLAWGTDFITWLKLSEANNGIASIDGAYVNWRISKENISPNKTNPIIIRKMNSLIDNVVWIKEFLMRNGYYYSFFYYKFFFGEMIRQNASLNPNDIKSLIKTFSRKTEVYLIPTLFNVCWKFICKFYKKAEK